MLGARDPGITLNGVSEEFVCVSFEINTPGGSAGQGNLSENLLMEACWDILFLFIIRSSEKPQKLMWRTSSDLKREQKKLRHFNSITSKRGH